MTNKKMNSALRGWIERWDRQQELYLPYREERFDAMATVLRHLVASERLSPGLRILDLGCGTGAIGQRLLSRFPAATYVGLDVDAALLELASALQPEFGERFTVLQRDLALDTWRTGFADGEFDVVASSTALHWVDRQGIEQLFHQLAPLLRPGGVFFNADNLAFASGYWQDIATAVDLEQQRRAAARGQEDWEAWWAAARADPLLAKFVAERDLRFPPRSADTLPAGPPPLSDYVEALESAGFVDIDVLWQRLDDRLLAARRSPE
ncbi:MAG: class I SAM-dependent methyltransferase [Thermomicrobiales bacterium]|nr:class I SAM-dependent methyltransferase [Thermomicrobiales bacterium]